MDNIGSSCIKCCVKKYEYSKKNSTIALVG